MIFVPRQARDTHRENSKKRRRFSQADYGKALGPPTVTKYGPPPAAKGDTQGEIWERKFSNGAVVTVNCTATGDVPYWCVGNITSGTVN
jgi:hypothetical protein